MKLKDLHTQPIYKTPFTPAYWRDAASQLFDVRILTVAAILIAMRVALKSLWIPVGPELNITIGFFVNALGASVFGPVVAVIAAAVSDTLGCIIFPTGTYFFPFIFVEIAGSLIFALFLWRAKLSATRVILSRFFVVAVCNFIMNPSIMLWYYAWLNNGKSYAFVTVPRVMKNLALFPAEALLLIIFLGALIPVLSKLRLIPKEQVGDSVIAKKHIILLSVLTVISVFIVAGYYNLFMPTQPQSVKVTEGNYTLTLKSERGTYDLDDIYANAPLNFTATLKNNAKTELSVTYNGEWCDITLVSEDGVTMPAPVVSDEVQDIVIGGGKSVKYTDTFAAEWAELGDIPKGKYTAVATVSITVDGEPLTIKAELPIKIK